ncbi:MAG: glycoside hydrolase family 15 protein [Polyangia bacterium]
MRKSVEQHDSTRPTHASRAPGQPGATPRWTASAKGAVGSSPARTSRIWFTIGRGVLNEVYFPDVDKANTRNMRFLVTDGVDYFSDEERDAEHECSAVADGIFAYTVVSTCKHGRYRVTKQFVAHAIRDTLLVKVHFEPLVKDANLRLFLYLEPHLADKGAGNDAWVGQYKGLSMLFAHRAQAYLAAHATAPWKSTTCGYIGQDAYDALETTRTLTALYNDAPAGNVSLCGELDWQGSRGEFCVALAFGHSSAEAAQGARAGSLESFDRVWDRYVADWKQVQQKFAPLSVAGCTHDLYRTSTAVMTTHESARFPGAFVASLSLPWGFARGDEDTGAYHVLWPRDLCETAMGLMAAGDLDAGRRALFYLACTQSADGSWSQNMWLDGSEHWDATQMDGIAMPILLADQLRREAALSDFDAWPMIQAAATFLVRQGPASPQDRWESLAGYATFTMACEVAALLAAADFAERANDPATAAFLRATADAWNDAVDSLTYARGTALAKKHGVDGYYVRVMPPTAIGDHALHELQLHLKNHVAHAGYHPAQEVVSPDALALVRYGLRSATDPRMTATAKVIDAELRKELKTGPGWLRSTNDGYGEQADGAPFKKTGIGRCWPLLAGERGHFELAAGNTAGAAELLRVMSRQSNMCGLLPEQVWDAADISGRDLYNGRPSGSAMPLAWAHAEYVKLLRSVHDGKVWDVPPQTVQRYQVEQRVSPFEIWSEHLRRHWVTSGKSLRMDFDSATTICTQVDADPKRTSDTEAPLLGRHCVHVALPREWTSLKVSYDDADGSPHTVRLACRRAA